MTYLCNLITSNDSVTAGKYWMYRKEFQLSSFQARKFWAEIVYGWGGFYGGRIHSLESSLGINVDKHINFRTDYNYNRIRISTGTVRTNELAEYINYAFNPNLDLSFFIQWNSLEDFMFGNFRLHWIPKPGTDLFVVYNRGYDKLKYFKFVDPGSSTGAAKLVWRFVF